MIDKLTLELINVEELPDPYKEMAELIGVENTIKLAERFGGITAYLPKVDSIVRKARDEKIKEEFNGYNYDSLARKYNISSQWVRIIVEEVKQQARAKPLDGQVSLLSL